MRYLHRRANPDIDFIGMLIEKSFPADTQIPINTVSNLSTEEQVFRSLESLLFLYKMCALLVGMDPEIINNALTKNINSTSDAFYAWTSLSIIDWRDVKSGVTVRPSLGNVHTINTPFYMFVEEQENQYTGETTLREIRSFGLSNPYYLSKIADAIAAAISTMNIYFINQPTLSKGNGAKKPVTAESVFWSHLFQV